MFSDPGSLPPALPQTTPCPSRPHTPEESEEEGLSLALPQCLWPPHSPSSRHSFSSSLVKVLRLTSSGPMSLCGHPCFTSKAWAKWPLTPKHSQMVVAGGARDMVNPQTPQGPPTGSAQSVPPSCLQQFLAWSSEVFIIQGWAPFLTGSGARSKWEWEPGGREWGGKAGWSGAQEGAGKKWQPGPLSPWVLPPTTSDLWEDPPHLWFPSPRLSSHSPGPPLASRLLPILDAPVPSLQS